MVIRDRETGSLWQHATGEALTGPLQGAKLDLLGGDLCTWSAWKKAHPDTVAALEPEEWKGLIPKVKTHAILEKVTRAMVAPGLTKDDDRLPPFEMVVGISIGDLTRAYPLAQLQRLGTIEEKIADRLIRLSYKAGDNQVEAFINGVPQHVQRTWWIGWYEFHPQTTIFKSN